MSPLITLTSDFGTRDPYVATIKGVILSVCHNATLVDLSHDIAPGDICECALFLSAAVPHFPEDTIHLVVVDPGVGTPRKAIVARLNSQSFVCPDNGVLTLLDDVHGLERAYEITNGDLQRPNPSHTFHGRDIFAPVAAHLACGTPLEDVGPELHTLDRLAWPSPSHNGSDEVMGEVIHIDRYGNLITNIHHDDISSFDSVEIRIGTLTLDKISRTYADVDAGARVALIGSTDRLEVSINGENAARTLSLNRGEKVWVRCR